MGEKIMAGLAAATFVVVIVAGSIFISKNVWGDCKNIPLVGTVCAGGISK